MVKMVKIKPFRGYHYNRAKVGDFASVITPPYDVISAEAEKRFYAKSPYNFARIILPKAEGKLTSYENAARVLKEWIKDKVLVQDPSPAIYIYAHTYTTGGQKPQKSTRFGFVSLLDIGASNEVFSHEQTLQKPFEDRLKLTEATAAYFGLVFLLYDDQQKVIDTLLERQTQGRDPLIVFTDEDGVEHRLWAVTDDAAIQKITAEMTQYTCVIADGHHRFKVARMYYQQRLEKKQDPESARWPIMCFVNSFNEGTVIRPTNRIVFNVQVPKDLLALLHQNFDITEEKDIAAALNKVRTAQVLLNEATNLKNHVFAMYDNAAQKGYFLRLRDPHVLQGEGHSDIYTKTDVNILHTLVLRDVLGISADDQVKQTKVEYVKGDEATLEQLQKQPDKYVLGFFLNPPLMREVFLTARSGENMPQKSTYFFPKMFSGLVVHKLPDT